MRGVALGITVLCGALVALVSPCRAQITIIPQKSLEEAANPTSVEGSTLRFENGGTLSFGTIGEDDGLWQGEIAWRTTDGKKLSITRITTSCNCVVAEWNRKANTSAKSGTIGVKYYPKGHGGKVEQRLLIYTSLSHDKPSAVVKIVGTVTPSANRSGDYPHQMGTLLVRQKSVSLPAEGGVARIAVMNGGSTPLEVSHDATLTLGGVKAYTVPARLESGEEGDLVVEIEPDGEPAILYLKGVNAPPRARKIEIKIEK